MSRREWGASGRATNSTVRVSTLTLSQVGIHLEHFQEIDNMIRILLFEGSL